MSLSAVGDMIVLTVTISQLCFNHSSALQKCPIRYTVSKRFVSILCILIAIAILNLHNHLLLQDGKPDRSYFAPDCFHFSRIGHEVGGHYLWNNMVSANTISS